MSLISFLMSSTLPATISEPNPPLRLGHRNASVAPPNWAPNTSSDTISELRKKSRREIDLTGLLGELDLAVGRLACLPVARG